METEPETIEIRQKLFFKVARDVKEYQRSVVPKSELVEKLRRKNVDIFTFIERRWCCPIESPSASWVRAEDNIGLLTVTSYDEWLNLIGKKTRNMIRKAEKSGIRTQVAEPNEKLAEGIFGIYNETPIRQERAFPHYGVSLQNVDKEVRSSKNCIYVGAYLDDELVGFVQLVHGDKIIIISQILSMQRHLDKAVTNSLVAKAIEVGVDMHIGWVMYGRMGNHPSLDNFKQNNGFEKFKLTRYYIPLRTKGEIAIRLGLHRELKDVLPQAVKEPLFPVYNWISRTRMRIRLLAR